MGDLRWPDVRRIGKRVAEKLAEFDSAQRNSARVWFPSG